MVNIPRNLLGENNKRYFKDIFGDDEEIDEDLFIKQFGRLDWHELRISLLSPEQREIYDNVCA